MSPKKAILGKVRLVFRETFMPRIEVFTDEQMITIGKQQYGKTPTQCVSHNDIVIYGKVIAFFPNR